MKKIFIFIGNPIDSSLSCSAGSVYKEAAEKAGAEVRSMNIGDMQFDPVLHHGYEKIQELEPDLLTFQENIRWADHLVFIYPNWWTSMPAKMKGLFDRSFLPKFAFSFKDGKVLQLLKGKTGRIINFGGSVHPWKLYCYMGPFTNVLRKGILMFCGVKPVRVVKFGPSGSVSDETRKRWLEKVAAIARKEAK